MTQEFSERIINKENKFEKTSEGFTEKEFEEFTEENKNLLRNVSLIQFTFNFFMQAMEEFSGKVKAFSTNIKAEEPILNGPFLLDFVKQANEFLLEFEKNKNT